MRNNEFLDFVDTIKTIGFENEEIQSRGYLWLKLTDKQVAKLYDLAIDNGYRPADDGTIKVGIYVLSKVDNEVIQKGTNEMSKNEEVKTEATETTAPAVITEAEPAPADVKKLEAAVNRVQKKIDKIAKCYIEVIGDVALLYDDKNFKALGYKNIYDLARDKFGMSRGTVNNLLSVYDRFGENYKLKDEYKDMSLRELLDHIRKEKAAQRTLEIGEEAELDEVTDGDEESTDGNGAGGKKGKKETLVKFDFDTIDSWTIDELIEKFREELGDGFTIPANAHINFVVTE